MMFTIILNNIRRLFRRYCKEQNEINHDHTIQSSKIPLSSTLAENLFPWFAAD